MDASVADRVLYDPPAHDGGTTEHLEDLRRDAERYRAWRDAACYRPAEAAKAMAPCITPDQIDSAVDRMI